MKNRDSFSLELLAFNGNITKNNIIIDFLLGISCFIFRDSQSPSKNVLTNMRVPKEGRKRTKGER